MDSRAHTQTRTHSEARLIARQLDACPARRADDTLKQRHLAHPRLIGRLQARLLRPQIGQFGSPPLSAQLGAATIVRHPCKLSLLERLAHVCTHRRVTGARQAPARARRRRHRRRRRANSFLNLPCLHTTAHRHGARESGDCALATDRDTYGTLGESWLYSNAPRSALRPAYVAAPFALLPLAPAAVARLRIAAQGPISAYDARAYGRGQDEPAARRCRAAPLTAVYSTERPVVLCCLGPPPAGPPASGPATLPSSWL